jgi:type I restriction enzyme R subunit
LQEVDFELELIHKDEINVSYILKLLAKYRKAKEAEQKKQRDTIVGIINAQPGLRSKRELIEKFIDEHLMHIEDDDLIDDAFEKFWDEEQVKAFDELCEEENLNKAEVNKVIDTYLYDGRAPLKDDIANTLNVKPKLLERKKIVPRVLDKIMGFVEKFYDGGVGMGTNSVKAANSQDYTSAISGNAMMAAENTEEYTGQSPKE